MQRYGPDSALIIVGANGEDGYSGFTMGDPRSGETVAAPKS